MGIGKTSVYRAVQAAAQKIPGMKRKELLAGYKTGAAGADVTSVRKPSKGKRFDIAYRMRSLFLDRWNLWPRLTFYRTWRDEYGHPKLDGTNNGCERSIGWWVKERYRSMRGYKREQSALNVSRLIAHAGNHLSRGLDLAKLFA
jgi:hypothetical protein